MTFKEKLQHKYALSEQGAKDMIHAFISATISNIVLMFPVGMLYLLVKNYMEETLKEKGILFAAGCLICLILIGVTTYIQYNATFLSTYVESGVRRITLAEKLRKIPLSFFGKKDLSDLTSTIMADCATLETASSHWIPAGFTKFCRIYIPVGIVTGIHNLYGISCIQFSDLVAAVIRLGCS